MSIPEQIDLFINNQDVPAEHYFERKDPGRLNEVVARVALGSVQQTNDAVQAAHDAFQVWRATDVSERVQCLLKAADALEKYKAELTPLLAREQGLLIKDSARDVNGGISSLRNTADIAPSFFQPELHEDEESWISVEKTPRGVTVAIVPWNAPINLTFTSVAPTLVAGNTVVVKPSPYAPAAVSKALKIVAAFFPPGTINIVHGEGEVGQTLTRHPLVRKISFTGGIGTGKLVMADAATNLKSISLELGGNDPAIILDDVNPAEIIPKILPIALIRSGQVCYAIKRTYVPTKMYDKFFDLMCQAVDELVVGHGLNERSTLAPLNNEIGFNRVKELVERTKNSNATVRQLGKKLDPEQWNNGYYMLPAVIGNVEPSSEIVTCEQFGPVIPIIPYDTEEQVIRMANDTEFGLCSSVWSNDQDRALRIARQIEAGTTFINSHSRTRLGDSVIPFGGVKQSGIGRVRTHIGLAEHVEFHAISIKK